VSLRLLWLGVYVVIENVPFLEGNGACDKLIECNTHGVLVGLMINRASDDLFRSHVIGRPGHLGVCLSPLLDNPRQSEIGDFDLLVRFCPKEVCRFNIPVDNALSMGICQGLENLCGQDKGGFNRELPLLNEELFQ